ncbi:hypothetical protein HYT45_02930 [Candidatus Uhrbacteria bacterium]|nr:hypothetical protein [Candidatus Uhrbacteria bacterium]
MDEQKTAEDQVIKEITQALVGLMRQGEEMVSEAVPHGPISTLSTLDEIIAGLTDVRNEIAAGVRDDAIEQLLGGELPDCGNPDCPNHEMARAEAAAEVPTELELHDETDPGAQEQPVPSDSDPDFDEID